MSSPETPYLDQFASAHPGIPSTLHKRHLRGQDRVMRWISSLVPSRVQESNLSHIESLLRQDEEIETNFPRLTAGIDMNRVKAMHYIHDTGELIVGDLVRSRLDYATVKEDHKRKEEEGFYFLIDRYVEDPLLRQEATGLYQEYLERKTPESLMANLLDKIQAIRFALQYVYDMNRAQNPDDRATYVEQANKSIELIFQFANPLKGMLSGEARGQLVVFLQLEFNKYWIAGYHEISQEARSRLFRKL